MVTILTKNGGLNVILKGVKSGKAKLKLAASLFSYVDYYCFDGDVKQVKSATVLKPHLDLTADIKKYAAAAIIVEAVEKLCREGNETIAEFEVVKNSLDIIEEGSMAPLLVAIVALKTLLDIEGVDITEYTLSQRVKSVFAYISNSEGDIYDDLDCTEAELLVVLSSLAKIYTHAFSIRVMAIEETIKALGR